MTSSQQYSSKVKVSFKQAIGMLYPYGKSRVVAQIKSVSLIILYLIFFQVLVLGIPLTKAAILGLGILLVVLGLTFFMEGLILGLMPLGESCGIQLPQKSKLPVMLIFSLILGFGATLAEPAIGVLKAAGSSVKAWNAPLLFLILNKYSNYLVYAVGIGVGIAVIAGMLRFLYSWSLKPYIYSLVAVLGALSVWAFFDPNLKYVIGLAWDCGGVTTGPVTVPLVIALGIGVSRVVGGKNTGTGGGFGVVTLASAFPVLTVMLLGIFFMNDVPKPADEVDFLKPANHQNVLFLFNNEDEMTGYVLKNASVDGRSAFFGNDKQKYINTMRDILKNDIRRNTVFGKDPVYDVWLNKNVPADEKKLLLETTNLTSVISEDRSKYDPTKFDFLKVASVNGLAALQAILPLSIFLIFVLLFVLRQKIHKADELLLGLLFAVIGMTFFNIGIELGLSKLGNQIGDKLPASFKSIDLPEQKKIISNFEPSLVYTAVTPDGNTDNFFYAKINNNYTGLRFESKNYDPNTKEYTYIPKKGPLFGKENGFWGMFIVLLFAFIMGYGATLAEPALNALGQTVEEISVGTFKKSLLMQSVAIGVGVGMVFGIAKIIWNIPLIYIILPPYILLIFITKISIDDYVNIGWDSAGVTTGPITVPLVLAMGLGIGGQIGAIEGFGILATASVFPILSVLCVGLYITNRRQQVIKESAEELK